MKWLIETGETFYLPEHECYYMIRDKHLLVYYSPDNQLHLSMDELNTLDCISLPAALFDTAKKYLTGFTPSYYWTLKYNFNSPSKEHHSSPYEAVDFNFSNQQHYIQAAKLISGIKDKAAQKPAAISISTYDQEVKQTDLDWIYVAPEYQGKGCGRFLIEETLKRCKHKSVNICVAGTVDFYRKCGFINNELWSWAPKPNYHFKATGIQP